LAPSHCASGRGFGGCISGFHPAARSCFQSCRAFSLDVGARGPAPPAFPLNPRIPTTPSPLGQSSVCVPPALRRESRILLSATFSFIGFLTGCHGLAEQTFNVCRPSRFCLGSYATLVAGFFGRDWPLPGSRCSSMSLCPAHALVPSFLSIVHGRFIGRSRWCFFFKVRPERQCFPLPLRFLVSLSPPFSFFRDLRLTANLRSGVSLTRASPQFPLIRTSLIAAIFFRSSFSVTVALPRRPRTCFPPPPSPSLFGKRRAFSSSNTVFLFGDGVAAVFPPLQRRALETGG